MARPTTARAVTPEPEAVSPDLALVTQSQTALDGFFRGLTTFFQDAREIEAAARTALTKAQALPAPTSATEDQAVQVFIQDCNAGKKAAEAHWGICATVFQLHKKLVAGRNRPVELREQAVALAQQKHNGYVDAERRRVAAEQERLRQEAEDRARREREAELKKAEEDALKLEAASADLSEREQDFVAHILAGVGPEQAALKAGYKDRYIGLRLLQRPKIEQAIEARRAAELLRQQTAAKAAAPLEVKVEQAAPANVIAMGSDRTTWSAELLDADAFLAAVLDPKTRTALGIPAAVVKIDEPELNRCAKDLKELINRWPGVRAKKTTRTY